jgi:hypothetical protein
MNRTWKKSVEVYFELLSKHLPGRIEKEIPSKLYGFWECVNHYRMVTSPSVDERSE